MKLSRSIRNAGSLLKETALSWAGSKTPRLGAALAYYTVFAITPLFLVALTIAGLCFGEEAARHELFGQISALVGPEGGEAIQSIIAAAGKKPGTGFLAGALAVITLFVGASGVFIELQDALNTIWNVKRKPGRGWRRFIRDRLLSFGMIVGVGFLLLVSLILSAGVTALGKYLSDTFPAEGLFWQVSNFYVAGGDHVSLRDDPQDPARRENRLAGRLAGRIPHGVVVQPGKIPAGILSGQKHGGVGLRCGPVRWSSF